MNAIRNITLSIAQFIIVFSGGHNFATAQKAEAPCLAAPDLLECNKTQDCSQLRIDIRCPTSDRACANLRDSQTAFLRAQRSACESQNARLRETCEVAKAALKAAGARCLPTLPVPSEATLWNHNGSTMRLIADGSKRKFVYEEPREVLAKFGVRKGTLLFEGTKTGNNYSGVAYIFSGACGARPYEVEGPVSEDQRQVTVFGKAPRFDQNCVVTTHQNDILVFSFIGN